MKIVAIPVAWFLVSGLAAGQCPTVQSLVFQPSSENIRIVTLFRGKPKKQAIVDVIAFPNDLTARYTLVTNDEGIAIPPTLPPGRYHIEAWTTQGSLADLYIDVPLDGQRTPIVYSMNLQRDTFLQGAIADATAAEKASSGNVVQKFAGVVQDPSGAIVIGAAVEVWKIGAQGETLVGQISSGSDGRFSLSLADGSYVALFRSSGFRDKVVPFEIAISSSSKDNRQSMVVGLDVNAC